MVEEEPGESALKHIKVHQLENKKPIVPEKPLMPSSDASEMSFDATYSYKPKIKQNIYKQAPKSNP